VISIDSLFDLLFGSLYDKVILKIKRLRARLILRKSSRDLEWFQIYRRDSRYIEALLNDENTLNLFISREYRKDVFEKPDLRKEFINQLESKF